MCEADDRVNYRSPREGLFGILKELTNQCIIIANEPPLNYIPVSITHPGVLQPQASVALGLLNPLAKANFSGMCGNSSSAQTINLNAMSLLVDTSAEI